jgi:hypothetical protein
MNKRIMKTSILTFHFALLLALAGCGQPAESPLVTIDVTRNYPEKEIKLSEVADVTYVQLKADNDDYLFMGQPLAITENNIVVYDRSSGSILFFAKDGTPKSRFNHKGNGPGEYTNVDYAVYDEARDELYLTFFLRKKIEVYSATGAHKRTLPVPQGSYVTKIFRFDETSLFLYDYRRVYISAIRHLNKVRGENTMGEEQAGEATYPKPFVRISSTDGSPLSYADMPENNEMELVASSIIDGQVIAAIPAHTNRIIRYKDDYLLCNPETDTIFLCNKDLELTPLLVQTPSVRTLKPEVFLNNMFEAGAYQFIEYFTLTPEMGRRFPSTILARDTKSGEVYKAKVQCDDFEGKELPLSTNLAVRTESAAATAFIEWELSELKQALSENKLSGPLKALVEASNENEDNNIYVLLQFK